MDNDVKAEHKRNVPSVAPEQLDAMPDPDFGDDWRQRDEDALQA